MPLEMLQRTRPRRVRLAKTDRWLWVMLSRLWAGWPTALVIVKPTGLSAVVDLEESPQDGPTNRAQTSVR